MEDFLIGLAPPIIKGVLLGGLYVVIALGLSLVFGVMKLINVGHGDLVVLGSYFAWAAMTSLGIDPFLSLVVGVPLFFAFGFFVQKFIINRTFRISVDAALIACFGISIIVQSFCQTIWTPFARSLTTPYALQTFAVGPLIISLGYLLDFIGGLAVMLALREFLRRTYLGRAISAASQNKTVAVRMGINPNRVYSFAFAIAMACAAVAGLDHLLWRDNNGGFRQHGGDIYRRHDLWVNPDPRGVSLGGFYVGSKYRRLFAGVCGISRETARHIWSLEIR
jgi:branched-chain amino acid transport system permease protein